MDPEPTAVIDAVEPPPLRPLGDGLKGVGRVVSGTMGLGELASWLSRQLSGPAASHDVTDRHRELARSASSETVTPELLALPGDRTTQPVATYLEADERPEFLLHGSRLLISDADDELARKHPTLMLVVLVTDRRVVFVVGGRLADDCLEVPLSTVTDAYVDEADPQRHLVVSADREGEPMTFFADLTMEPQAEAVLEAAEFIGARE